MKVALCCSWETENIWATICIAGSHPMCTHTRQFFYIPMYIHTLISRTETA